MNTVTENNHKGSYLLLFSNCIPVKGAARSLIVDTQRNEMFFIDNTLYDILSETREKKWNDILMEYDEESHPVLEKYVAYLETNELCFWADDTTLFPVLNLEWDAPAKITNAIIDVNSTSNHNWTDIFKKLLALGCRDIQVRSFDNMDIDIIGKFLSHLRGSFIKSIELIIKYEDGFTKKYFNKLVEDHTRIKTIIIHSSPRDEIYRFRNSYGSSGMGNIVFVQQVIESKNHCGIVNMDYFTLSGINTFTEFKNFNSCLNRKIAIDVDGSIKNCPSMPKVYGNIGDDDIERLIDDEFKSVWHITKDQVDICKVCEFRYVCSDCRAYTSNPENNLSKPQKCSYDPYKMEWL